jgi:O-antigen ligase
VNPPLLQEDDAAGEPELTPNQSARPSIGYWLYAGHLLGIVRMALSNVLLGLTVLSFLLAAPWPAAVWKRVAPVALPLGLYVLLLLGSIVASYDPAMSWPAASEIFNLATLPLALILVRGERPVRRLFDAFLIAAGIFAAWGLAQYLWGYGDIDSRIRGPFSHYMTFSGVLLIADALLLATVACRQGWRNPWRWAGLVLINAALLGSLTRNAWVSLLLTLTIVLALRAPRLLLAYLPVGLVCFILAPVPLLHRAVSIFDLQDRSNYDRLCMVEAGLTMIAERPMFGIGPNLVKVRYPIYRPPTAPRYEVPHLHNSLLQMAAERGLPFAGVYLALIGSSVFVALSRFRSEGGVKGPRADLHLGVILAIFAFSIAGLFENNWGDTEVQRVILFVLALPFCLTEPERP